MSCVVFDKTGNSILFKNSFEIVAYCFKIVARGSCVVFDKTGNSIFF